MKPEDTIDYHLRKAWAGIARHYNAEAARFGGTMSTGYILLNIDKEGTPHTKLGPKMGMESRSLTRTLKDLAARGLIEKRTDPRDKRLTRIHLTAEGVRMREHSRDVVLGFNLSLRTRMGDDRCNTIISLMADLNRLLDTKALTYEPLSL